MGNNLCKDNINNLQFCPSKMNKKDEKYWNKYILETCTPMDPKDTIRISQPQTQNNMENIPVAPPRKKRTKLIIQNNQSDLIIKNGFKDVFYNENNIIYDNNNYNNNINTTNNNNYKHFYNSLSPNSKEKLKTINIGNRKSDKFFGENLYDSLANEPIESTPKTPPVLVSTQKMFTSKTLNTEPISSNHVDNKINNNNYQMSNQENNLIEASSKVSEVSVVAPPGNDNKNILLDEKSKFLLTMLTGNDTNDTGSLIAPDETINNNEAPKATPRKNKTKNNYNNNKTPEKPQRTFGKLINNNNISSTKKQAQPTLTRNASMPHTNLYFNQYNTNNNNNNNHINNNDNTDNDNENKEKIVNFLKKCKSSNTFLTEIIMDDMIRKVYDFNINSDYWLNDNHTYCDDGICDGSTIFTPKTVNAGAKPKFCIGNTEIIKNEDLKPTSDCSTEETYDGNVKQEELVKIIVEDTKDIQQNENILEANTSSKNEIIENVIQESPVIADIPADTKTESKTTNADCESNKPCDITTTEVQAEIKDNDECKEVKKFEEILQSIDSSIPTENIEESVKTPIGIEIDCQPQVNFKIEPHVRKVSVPCYLPSISEDDSKSNEDLRTIEQGEGLLVEATKITEYLESKPVVKRSVSFDLSEPTEQPFVTSSEEKSSEVKLSITNEPEVSPIIISDCLEKIEVTTMDGEEKINSDTEKKLSNKIETYALEDIYKNKNNILNEFHDFLRGEVVTEKCDEKTAIVKSIDEVLNELDEGAINAVEVDDVIVKETISNDFIFVESAEPKSKKIDNEVVENIEENDDKVKIVDFIKKLPKKPKRKRSQSVCDYRSDSIEELDLWFSKHSESPFENKSIKSVIHGTRLARRGSDGNCAYDTRKLFPFGSSITQERTLLESVEFFTSINDSKEKLNKVEKKNDKIEDHSTLFKYLK